MEYFEGIRNFFRKKQPPDIIPADLNAEARVMWSYEYLREYLLALTKGYEFLSPEWRFPEVLELTKDWFDVFDKLSAETVNGTEHYALIGFRQDKRRLVLPMIPTKGLTNHVSPEIMERAIEHAKQQAGIDGLIGDIHSHPSGKNPERNPFQEDDFTENFSAADLYRLVIKRRPPYIMGLTGIKNNVIAMQTRETVEIMIDPRDMSQDDFSRYWTERKGFRYNAPTEENGRATLTHITPDATVWNVNKAIAERHHLVIYRGQPGENLKRVIPVLK